ncbi:MAG TPA: 1-phosphofructokinase family hexose kinase [Afifellaceae bacterium]|nr:1-phosphofructokinase family hexose kinase [Afifellaceae bacterium]
MPAIVTLTLNPTIDGSSEAELVRPVHKVRTSNERYDPGGGGINVARVVRELGGDALAICLAGGTTGPVLDALLAEHAVPRRLVAIAGPTRISHTVFEQSSGQEFRFVPEGPHLSPAEVRACLDAVAAVECAYFVASGSLPPGAPEDLLAQAGRIAAGRGARFVLDSSGAGLKGTLGAAPVHLVKPSLGELTALVGRELPDAASQEAAATELVASGAAEMVALTLGHDGAILASRDGIQRAAALDVPVRSAVGAGDSFLAAMVCALAQGRPPREAFLRGIAGGTAAVLTPGTELAHRADVERLYRQLTG